MARSSASKKSATAITEISHIEQDASNMNAINANVIRIAIDAAEISTPVIPVVCTALEACFYPVDDTMSGGYCLDSGLNAAASTATSPRVYNPEYSPATPFHVKGAFPSTQVVVVEQDLLAPYAGKSVTLAYLVGYDPVTNEAIEMGFDTVPAENAKVIATAAATKHKLPVIIKCAETGKSIYTQGKDATGNRAVRVTSTATVKIAKGASAEEIAAQQEAARVKAEQAAEAARVKAEEALKAAQAKIEKAEKAARDRQIAENAKNMAKVLKAKRTAPDAGTDNYAIFESLKKAEGATCKELNFEHDERNGNPYGTSNRGWKQIAQKLAETCNQELYQGLRVCKRTTSVNIILMPAFKLASKGTTQEEVGAGWTRIK